MELTCTAALSPALCFRSHSYFISFNNPTSKQLHTGNKNMAHHYKYLQEQIFTCRMQKALMQIIEGIQFTASTSCVSSRDLSTLVLYLRQAPRMVLLVLRNCFLRWFWFRQFLLTPPHQRGVWACTRSWEQTQPGQLTSTDQRDITYHMASCSAYKRGEGEEGRRDVQSYGICLPK